MDRMRCFELRDVGSIPAGPARLPVVQWIERGPPKTQMQVRFLPGRPKEVDTMLR